VGKQALLGNSGQGQSQSQSPNPNPSLNLEAKEKEKTGQLSETAEVEEVGKENSEGVGMGA
jgi:hypothetical protein